jgi:hypothetical protein
MMTHVIQVISISIILSTKRMTIRLEEWSSLLLLARWTGTGRPVIKYLDYTFSRLNKLAS